MRRLSKNLLVLAFILCGGWLIASTAVPWMGTTYQIPGVGESDWAGPTKVDGLLISLGTNAFSKAGGNFTLTADANFGSSYGLLSKYFTDNSGVAATSGAFRLSNGSSVSWLNAAGNANLPLSVNSSNNLVFNGTTIMSSSGLVPVASGGTNLASYTSGDMLYASGTTTLSKLAIGGSSTVLVSNGTAPQYAQVMNAMVDPGAAIARTKIANGTASHVVINDGSGTLSSEATLSKSRGGAGADMSSVTFPSSGTIATIAGTQVFTNKDYDGGTASNTSRITIPKDTLANVTSLTRKQGTVVYASDVDKIYKDNGSTLTEIGSGSGGINYVTNPDAESGTTGWTTYADAAATSPVDGTGGSPTAAISRTTTTPLRGTGAFLLTKDASNRQGEGVGYAFTIDSADKAKILNVSFDYEIPSGTFASGDSSDVRVFVYDVTNTVLVPVAPYTIQGGGSQQHKFTGMFQTASNSTSYRLIIHVATTSSSAWTFEFDNVVIGPQTQLYGAPIGDWTSYTPSWGGFGTVSGSAGYYRRVGDSVEIFATCTTGTVAASAATISLPSVTIDTAKTSGAISKLGEWASNATGSVGTALSNTGTSSTLVYFSDDAAASNGLSPANGSALTTNSTLFSTHFVVPVVGWSSTVLMSNDTDTRVVAMRASGNPAAATAGNPIIFPTADFDTHAAYSVSTGLYTVPVSGKYKVSTVLEGDVAGTNIGAYKNGSQESVIGNSSATYMFASGSAIINCVAGDTISVRPAANWNATGNSTMHIERLSGPSAVAATESVNALYESNTARAITNNAATTGEFLMEDKIFDSHNAYSTSTAIYTVPVSGKYRVGAAVGLANASGWEVGELLEIRLYKNGSHNRTLSRNVMHAASTNPIPTSGSTLVSCVAGDTLEIRILQDNDAGINTNSSQTDNWVSYERIGN